MPVTRRIGKLTSPYPAAPEAAFDAQAAVPLLQSANVSVSKPHGVRVSVDELKFGGNRPPVSRVAANVTLLLEGS